MGFDEDSPHLPRPHGKRCECECAIILSDILTKLASVPSFLPREGRTEPGQASSNDDAFRVRPSSHKEYDLCGHTPLGTSREMDKVSTPPLVLSSQPEIRRDVCPSQSDSGAGSDDTGPSATAGTMACNHINQCHTHRTEIDSERSLDTSSTEARTDWRRETVRCTEGGKTELNHRPTLSTI